MKLEDLLEIIESGLEFELYKGARIGIFVSDDKGLKEYIENDINEIQVKNERLVICLDY